MLSTRRESSRAAPLLLVEKLTIISRKLTNLDIWRNSCVGEKKPQRIARVYEKMCGYKTTHACPIFHSVFYPKFFHPSHNSTAAQWKMSYESFKKMHQSLSSETYLWILRLTIIVLITFHCVF